MAADGRCRWWVLGGSILGAALLGVVRAQDNTEPTAEELACWNQYNGGAYYNAATTTCEACATGRYDHDAIINMPHMNMNMNMEVTWWDALTSTDYNPVRTPPSLRSALRHAALCAASRSGCPGKCLCASDTARCAGGDRMH